MSTRIPTDQAHDCSRYPASTPPTSPTQGTFTAADGAVHQAEISPPDSPRLPPAPTPPPSPVEEPSGAAAEPEPIMLQQLRWVRGRIDEGGPVFMLQPPEGPPPRRHVFHGEPAPWVTAAPAPSVAGTSAAAAASSIAAATRTEAWPLRPTRDDYRAATTHRFRQGMLALYHQGAALVHGSAPAAAVSVQMIETVARMRGHVPANPLIRHFGIRLLAAEEVVTQPPNLAVVDVCGAMHRLLVSASRVGLSAEQQALLWQSRAELREWLLADIDTVVVRATAAVFGGEIQVLMESSHARGAGYMVRPGLVPQLLHVMSQFICDAFTPPGAAQTDWARYDSMACDALTLAQSAALRHFSLFHHP